MMTPTETARTQARPLASRWLTGLFATLLVVAINGCGGGTVHEPFVPSKIIALGDNIVVTTGGSRYTVNMSTSEVMTGVEQLAATYGLSTALTSTGSPNAKVASATSFSSSAIPLATQVSNYSTTIGSKDMFVLSAGTVDIIDEFWKGTKSTANITQAAADYVSVVQSLISKGAKRILVVSPYDLSITPWGQALSDKATLQNLVATFRDQLKAKLALAGVDGRIVVYVDLELEMNYVINNNSLTLTDRVTPVCSSAANDASNGIGIGPGELNSSLCTDASSSLITVSSATASPSAYAFADKIYPTPVVHRALGTAMYNATSSR